MKQVRVISGRGVPLKRSDVDTDQIIPAEWLKRVERTGSKRDCFPWRTIATVLNDERYGASILVAGTNFGGFIPRARRVGNSTGWIRRRDRAKFQRHLP